LNISAFYYDYTDLQVLSVIQTAGTVPSLVLDKSYLLSQRIHSTLG